MKIFVNTYNYPINYEKLIDNPYYNGKCGPHPDFLGISINLNNYINIAPYKIGLLQL